MTQEEINNILMGRTNQQVNQSAIYNEQQLNQLTNMQNGLAALINDYEQGHFQKMALVLLEQGVTTYLQMPQISMKDRTELLAFLNAQKGVETVKNEPKDQKSVMDLVEKNKKN